MPEQSILNNRYQLLERLGAGGMAMVYRARDLTLERTVAVKILRKEFSGDPGFRRRFQQEAKAAAGLSHSNIVTIHDFGYSADQLYIVMEYVPGTDLKTLQKNRGQFTIPEAVELVLQACAGIGYAHRAGLVHCDIKPQNMLVTPERRLKVLDFGIARALATISPDERSEVVWGSPQYFSPEQAAGAAPSPASDVYSLGVVLYEMLAGRLPFISDTADQLALLHREALAPSPRKFNPEIPVQLEQITLKVLSKEPAMRYRTADQLGRVLENFLHPPAPHPAAALHPAAAGQPAATPRPAPPAYTPPAAPAYAPPPRPAAAYAPPARPAPAARPAPPPTAPLERGYAVYDSPPEYDPDGQDDDEPDVVIVTGALRRAEFDWFTWLLALLALLAVGGLIPFWLWVIYMIRPLL
ncbi:MAG: protein kinase domain-containing protein [Chloroflexota bacterium]